MYPKLLPENYMLGRMLNNIKKFERILHFGTPADPAHDFLKYSFTITINPITP